MKNRQRVLKVLLCCALILGFTLPASLAEASSVTKQMTEDHMTDIVPTDERSGLPGMTLITPQEYVTPMIAAGSEYIVGLKSDGTVIAIGDNFAGKCDVGDWTEIVQVAASVGHTVGLKADGTVVAVGYPNHGQCDVSGWTDIVQIDAGGAVGEGHTVGLKSDGAVVAVGTNDDGQCDVEGWTGIVDVAAGGHHTVGLRVDGTAVAVGNNDDGQCDVSGWTDIVQIDAGSRHTVALKSDGTAVAVGYNYYGQCNVDSWTDVVQVAAGGYDTVELTSSGIAVGTGDSGSQSHRLGGWTNIVQVAVGWSGIAAGLRSDGSVVAVGLYDYGQCDVVGWADVIQVQAGDYYTVGLKSDGTVAAVGYGYQAQYSVGDWIDITEVAAGYGHTAGLKSDAMVVAVGDNNYGQCNVGGWTNIIQVAAGSHHTVGLKSDGAVVTAGDNNNGQCDVEGWTNIVQVAAGARHTIGLKSDGAVVAAGQEWSDECDVSEWTDIIQVAAGWSHTVGLKSDGTAVAVGSDYEGECDVSGWTDIVQIAAGRYHTMGLKSDGTVIAVGNNDDGQCNVDSWVDISQVVGGGWHTVGLKADGTVIAVGDNYYRQCNVGGWTDVAQVTAEDQCTAGAKADGTVIAVGVNSHGECDVSGWTNIIQVATGPWHTAGVKSDGTVVAAGANYDGECDVSDWTDIIQADAGGICGEAHTMGIKSDGTAVAVGANSHGQCDVMGWTNIVQIVAGGQHTVGLRFDGTVIAEGYNHDGQCDVDGWTDVVQIAAGTQHTVGLRSDGTVVVAGHNYEGECDVSEWTDIVQVSAADHHTLGLRSNGTVVAVGYDDYGQCNVESWTDIIQVAAGGSHAVGLKSDGTLVAAGIKIELAKWNLGETSPPDADSFADLGNFDDEATHNLVGWGDAQGPPDNPFISPSGDRTKRYMLLHGDNSLDLRVSGVGVSYLLAAEVEDGHCTDNFEIYVNGQGPLYSYTGTNAGTGNIAVVHHDVVIPQEYITGTLVTITFRNTATDDCGLAAVYNVGLQRAAQDDAKFVADVTIPDGISIQPGEEFIKTWRLRNTGTTTWTTDYKLVFEGGDLMGAVQYVSLDTTVPPNETVDISVPMAAPLDGGAKRDYWRMRNSSGLRFGHTVWVEIFVPYTPEPELQEAIDNLYDTTMQRLEWLKRDMQSTAEYGDFYCTQADAAKLEGGLKVALGFASMAGDVHNIVRLRQGIQLALPGMEAGWGDISRLAQHYKAAGFAFDLEWQHLLDTGNLGGLGPEILTGGLKYYAADGLQQLATDLDIAVVMKFYEWLAGRKDGFSEILYPAFISVVEMAQQDLTERRDQLLDSLPSLSPEEQVAYAADLNSRTQTARALYLSSTYTNVNLSAIKGFYEDEGWSTQLVLGILKWLARGLANATFDGLGRLLVDSFLTAHDAYISKFKYDEATQMAELAQGLMGRGVDTSNQLLLNGARGLDRVGDGVPARTVTGHIESISNYSVGKTPWWNPWGWDETESYSIVRLTNESIGTEPATFYIATTYLTDHKVIYGVETLLEAIAYSDNAIDIFPGDSVDLRVEYKDASSGDSPSKDSPMQIWVFGSNPSGTFRIDAESTYWDPQLVSQATGQRISDFSVASGGDEIEITENPVYVFLSALPEGLTYDVQTWVINPVAQNVTATVVQDLSEDWEVLSAPDAQSTNSTHLIWELDLEEGGLAQVSFTFAYHGDLSDDIVVPSPIVTLENLDGEPLGELIGNSPSLEPILPVTGSVTMPVEVMPGEQASVSVDLLNLSEDAADGDIIVSVTDPSSSCAYNQTQAFSLASSTNTTLDYLLPAFSEKGLYQVLTEISYGGVTRVMWRDVMRVGTMALEVSLNATPADRVYPGDTIAYTVSLNNTSAFTLNGVVAEATVPDGTLAHNISDDGQLEGQTVEWQLLDPLPPGETIELSFKATVMLDAVEPGEAIAIRTSAMAYSDEAFPVGSNEVRILLVANPAPVMGTIVGDVDLYGEIDNSGVLVTVNETYITTTASDGSFAIDVPGSTYDITFTYPGFYSGAYENVTVVAGEELSLPSAVLMPIEIIEIQLFLKAGWNMVSVPLALADNSTSTVFPGVAGVFTWDATSRSYYIPTVIDPEKGYWLAVTEDTTIAINGTPIETWTTDIRAGWNMIGSVNTTTSITDPNDDPDGSVIVPLYWWDPVGKSYILTTDIEPGKGYWVASLNDCTLTL
jgi:uncharacterized repeat protein (TIGR01451 family)